MATLAWSERFRTASLRHLMGVSSDHSPIFLRWRESARERRIIEEKIFRYELMWEKHENFRPHLEEVWDAEGQARSMGDLQQKLERVSKSHDSWGRHTFGHVQREIKQLTERMTSLRVEPTRQGPSYEEVKITQRLVELYNGEEVMWRQRSRVQWLAEGIKIRVFFHLRANQRKRRNKISKLKKPDGLFTEDRQEMAELTSSFYEHLYTSEGVTNMAEFINVIPTKVTMLMNDALLKPFRDEEVKEALFQMFPTKSPGPDGFPAHFFPNSLGSLR
ncbi:uncharacterized protein [Lolium perenne]|uniref:uncharacterized protein n=1 Tax=Lolium perenne TaxID=4522 RepID=UPI003A99D532